MKTTKFIQILIISLKIQIIMINGIILSIFFILPGGIILNMKKVRAKSDIFLIPFISFGYFNFLSLIFFLFDFEPFEYWFFIFSALSLFFNIQN